MEQLNKLNDINPTIECVTKSDRETIIDCAPGCCSPINSD